MLKTKITEMFGIEHPVIMGGMMWVGRAELVSAVANAGALGFLTALTQPTPDDLINEVARTREMTDQPFGVNLSIFPTLKASEQEAYAEAIVASGVKIIETAGRSPERFLEGFKAAGIKVIHKCTSVRHSRTAERIGCDAVSIDGFECAGHPGEDDVPGLVLIPATADAVDIPLIASGGFGDGRGLAAALSLGAEAICMGTRFLATKEARIHDKVKKRLVESDERNTNLILRTLGNTSRVHKNAASDKVVELEAQGATIEDLVPYIAGTEGRKVWETGALDDATWSTGLVVGLIHDVPTVKELIERIVEDACEIMAKRLQGMMI
ncbi:MAG: NAD(P)H-dependent flavin oxidoreductase [Alphaproteobacteria bacterium]